MTRLSPEKLLLAMALHDTQPGTQMAGTYIDTDGTATIELLERTPGGWKNLTTRTTNIHHSDAIAAKYDDIVTTHLPTALAEITDAMIRAANDAYFARLGEARIHSLDNAHEVYQEDMRAALTAALAVGPR